MKKNMFDGFAPPHTLSGFAPDTPILVGFSGGADSRFLLHLLAEYSKEHGTPIYAAHLNHGIRGDEAQRDEDFCRRVASAYGIPFFCERADVPRLAEESGESLELQARVCRYEFFGRVMRENNIPLLATAHNADDVLETVLFRLMRGTGTKGLAAIPPVRELGGSHVALRPILNYTKKDILEFCISLGLEYVTDSTNFEDDCTRNKIRLSVIPELEKISGDGTPQRAALRYSSFAREDDDALTQLALREIDPDTPCRINLDKLNSLHRAVAKRVIFKLYAHLFTDNGGDIPEDKTLSNVHVDAILTLAQKAVKHSSLNLPDGVSAAIEDGCLVFSRSKGCVDGSFYTDTVDVGLSKVNAAFSVLVEGSPSPLAPYKKGTQADSGKVFASVTLPRDDISLPIKIRQRENGDVIRTHGMTKKLKKLLCDKDIPLELRELLPIFATDSGEILWCPSVAVADGYPPPRDTAALRLTVIIHDV